MSIIGKAAKFTAFAGLCAYGMGLVTGPSIITEIEIAAPADQVWQALTDAGAYPDWNPFVTELTGDLRVGQRIQVTIEPNGNAPMVFTPEILVADTNSELRWVGRLGFRGIFDGEHYFILEQTPDDTTLLRHGERFRGILAYPLIGLIGGDTRKGFEAMNRSLKARVESKA